MFSYPTPTPSTLPLTCPGWKHIPTYFSAAPEHPVVSAPTLSQKNDLPKYTPHASCLGWSNELLADEAEEGPVQLPNSVKIKFDYNLAEKDGDISTESYNIILK